jgi:UDP-2,4-diacetamido-2,4,6-trideoxy-beta-L-altropyranose hydrolase
VLAHAQWLGATQSQDALACLSLLRDSPPDWVVVDHYALDARWQRRVAQGLGCRLAALDDLADREMAVDLLVDHNHAADHRAKYGAFLSPGAVLLGGPRHALLAPAYASAPAHVVAERVRSIGIFMGGTDEGGLSRVALEACREAGFDGPVEVVTTSACPHRGALQEEAARRPATTILVDLPDLSGFFSRHGLQIGAGGGATWERCCLGAPTLALAVADNQHHVLAPLAELGVLLASPPGASHAAWLARTIRHALDDAALRRRLSQSSRQWVDGEGARRVAQALLAHPGP